MKTWKENLKTYIKRTFRIVNGTASKENLKTTFSSHILLTYDEKKRNQSFNVAQRYTIETEKQN